MCSPFVNTTPFVFIDLRLPLRYYTYRQPLTPVSRHGSLDLDAVRVNRKHLSWKTADGLLIPAAGSIQHKSSRKTAGQYPPAGVVCFIRGMVVMCATEENTTLHFY